MKWNFLRYWREPIFSSSITYECPGEHCLKGMPSVNWLLFSQCGYRGLNRRNGFKNFKHFFISMYAYSTSFILIYKVVLFFVLITIFPSYIFIVWLAMYMKHYGIKCEINGIKNVANSLVLLEVYYTLSQQVSLCNSNN